MRIDGFLWVREVAEKLATKHGLTEDEVGHGDAMILSARDMDANERRRYE